MEMIVGLFVLVWLWTLVAAWRDVKTTIVANWITLSLVPTVLVYRLLFSWGAFVEGVVGLGVMVLITLGLYYGKVFGGADAKLLWGYGAALPWAVLGGMSGVLGVVLGILGFVVVLFACGAVWGLVWGLTIVAERKGLFRQEMSYAWRRGKWVFVSLLGLALVSWFVVGLWLALMFLILGGVWVYARALDKLLVVKQRPEKLIEGDWLKGRVKVGGKWIVPSAHGLSLAQIAVLRNAKKSVVIQQGAPFIPGFVIALAITAYFVLTLGLPWVSLLGL